MCKQSLKCSKMFSNLSVCLSVCPSLFSSLLFFLANVPKLFILSFLSKHVNRTRKASNPKTVYKNVCLKLYSMDQELSARQPFSWNTWILICDTMDIYSSDSSYWRMSASNVSPVWSIGCGRTYLLSRLEKRRIRLFLPKRWQIIEQNQRSST